ncbi:MAG: hypothetical protein JWQ43_2528 [Glaciihabitans sp.]|nr:hypothetical protein [Glaciihabitans sp.]
MIPFTSRTSVISIADSVDDELVAVLGPDTAILWQIDRGPQTPTIRVARTDGTIVAAVLTTRRPATAATKIANAWRDATTVGSDAALSELVAEVVADAMLRDDVAVKWQSRDELTPPESAGFIPLRTPYRSAAGTEGVHGFVRWLRPIRHAEPPYYSQTSTFTCGAVTALLASEMRGTGGFVVGGHLRDQEIDFWRRSSNFPACEPIGLAVALRESFPDAAGTSPVEVFLDTDGPVLLESYSERFDRSFREELQANSLQRAQHSDIAVHRERVSVETIAARLEAGELALLLLNIEPMFGYPVPHWVLAHAAGDGIVVIDDPWISATWGETWVDSHELPIMLGELDRMLAWGDSDYRGVVFIRRP